MLPVAVPHTGWAVTETVGALAVAFAGLMVMFVVFEIHPPALFALTVCMPGARPA
ncbi:hypothetical protein [Pedobacter paludis]|uniref:hypothetical protein n=1 Tax=Pedobacter paludis TaxID=2203212 RepID=UPI0013144832|nr:hypothetical protein [Pedobacter paludis]